MRALDFADAWTAVGRPGVAGTCRFNTHIDYVFTNKEVDRDWAESRNMKLPEVNGKHLT